MPTYPEYPAKNIGPPIFREKKIKPVITVWCTVLCTAGIFLFRKFSSRKYKTLTISERNLGKFTFLRRKREQCSSTRVRYEFGSVTEDICSFGLRSCAFFNTKPTCAQSKFESLVNLSIFLTQAKDKDVCVICTGTRVHSFITFALNLHQNRDSFTRTIARAPKIWIQPITQRSCVDAANSCLIVSSAMLSSVLVLWLEQQQSSLFLMTSVLFVFYANVLELHKNSCVVHWIVRRVISWVCLFAEKVRFTPTRAQCRIQRNLDHHGEFTHIRFRSRLSWLWRNTVWSSFFCMAGTPKITEHTRSVYGSTLAAGTCEFHLHICSILISDIYASIVVR